MNSEIPSLLSSYEPLTDYYEREDNGTEPYSDFIYANELGEDYSARNWLYVDRHGVLKVGLGCKLVTAFEASRTHTHKTPFYHKEGLPVSASLVEQEASFLLEYSENKDPRDINYEFLTNFRLTDLCTEALQKDMAMEAFHDFHDERPMPRLADSGFFMLPVPLRMILVDLTYYHTPEKMRTLTGLEQAIVDKNWAAMKKEIATIYTHEPQRVKTMKRMLKEAAALDKELNQTAGEAS